MTEEARTEGATLSDLDAVTSLATTFFVEEDFPLPSEGLRQRVERYMQMDGHAIFLARPNEGGDPIAFATVATGFGLEYK